MKVIKFFKNPKNWVFIILPAFLVIGWLALLIYADVISATNSALVITAQLLLTAAAALIFIPSFYGLTKQKRLLKIIASALLFAGFLGLQIFVVATIPKLCKAERERQELYEEFKKLSFDDENYREAANRATDAALKRDDFSIKIEIANTVSFTTFIAADAFAKPTKKENSEPEPAEE